MMMMMNGTVTKKTSRVVLQNLSQQASRRAAASSVAMNQVPEYSALQDLWSRYNNHQQVHSAAPTAIAATTPTSLDTLQKWKNLAALTNDPKILEVTEMLEQESQVELPTTLTEVMSDTRPCLVLSMEENEEDVDDEDHHHTPQARVINTNDRWTEFSGYLREESLNRTLDELLHGPETQQDIADAIVDRLGDKQQEQPSAEGVLTHYTRDGRKFQDLLRLGPIQVADGNNNEYLVGVLHEINC